MDNSVISLNCCPPELLILIFKHLDTHSLWNCINVNKTWRCIGASICQKNDLWPALAKIALISKDVTVKKRSALEWDELLFNYQLWNHVNKVKMSIIHVHHCTDLGNLHVYRDHIIISSSKGIQKKGIETFNEVILPMYSGLHEYEESDKLILTITIDEYSRKKTVLYDKSLNNETLSKMVEYNENKVFNHATSYYIKILRLEDNDCYLLDSSKEIWRYSINPPYSIWTIILLTKYFGSETNPIIAINVYIKKVYVLVSSGGVMLVHDKSMQMKKITHLDIPSNIFLSELIITPSSIIVVCGTPENDFRIIRQIDTNNLVLLFPNLTCITQHGVVYLMGFKNGDVEIYVTENFLEEEVKPKLKFNIKDLDVNVDDIKIIRIEVYEAYNAHHIFVGTSCKVYQVLLEYPLHFYDTDKLVK